MGLPENSKEILVSSINNYNLINGSSYHLYSRICSSSIHIFNILKLSRKNIIINLSLSIFSIYTPLFIYTLYDYFINNGTAASIENRRILREDIPQKIDALKAGYLPRMLPKHLKEKKRKPTLYPIGSLPHTKTYLCNEGYGLILYESDRFGLRNDDQKWQIAGDNSNIFVIGDSFIHGDCVPDDFTITSSIEKATNINTINLGSASNGPYDYLALLKSIVKPIIENTNNKHIVLVVFYANDNIPINLKDESFLNLANPIIKIPIKDDIKPIDLYTKEISSFIKENALEDKKEIILKLKNWENKNFKETTFFKLSSLYPVRRDIKIFFEKKSNFKNQTKSIYPDPSEETIILLSKICENKCKPIIAYIPNSNFFNPIPKTKEYKIKLEKIADKLGIEFIDGEKVINSNNRKDYAPHGGHLSINGYQKFSDSIINFIKNI